MTTKFYLGDGVYIEEQEFRFKLFTSDGLRETNHIFLEVETATALVEWLTKNHAQTL
jgi:hypothetical protein